MNVENIKLGDKIFVLAATYSFFGYLQYVRIKEAEVVKVNKKSFKVSYDADTKRWPEIILKKNTDVIGKSKLDLAEKILKGLRKPSCKWSKDLIQKTIKYCKRIIQQELKKVNCNGTL